MRDIAMRTSRVKYPFETAIFYPTWTLTVSPWVQRVNAFIFHLIPALVLDAVARYAE
jgi:hypothetical protein